MANAIEVSDARSNAPEQIELVAQAIARSRARRLVFEAIYFHKTRVKTVGYISERTGLTRMRVLQAGIHLVQKGIVYQTKKDGDTAYEQIVFFQVNKAKIMSLASKPKQLATFPTKRKVSVDLRDARVIHRVNVPLGTKQSEVTRITVDDVDSFAKVKQIESSRFLNDSISERQFKNGIQAILGEPGVFPDWGGEKSDLYSSRVRIKGKRLAAAFAFKGPGLKGRLTPGRMGKNGDQALRLFQEEADVFFVQHWREIDPAVIDMLDRFAVARSSRTGKRVWYGVIDGYDSERLRLAYPVQFRTGSRK
jgi:hypothetical protein